MPLSATRTISYFAFVAIMASPTFAQSNDVSEIENAPVNCETAENDLQILAEAKADANNQVAKGVSAITPGGAVLGILTGTEDEKLDMLSGDYIEKIDQKTAEIKATCGL